MNRESGFTTQHVELTTQINSLPRVADGADLHEVRVALQEPTIDVEKHIYII